MAKEKYISLKEAALLSGYSPDYVGQLIRRGKLPGKQVFSNVAWMTTEDAIRQYLDKNSPNRVPTLLESWNDRFLSRVDFSIFYKIVLGAIIALLGIFILFLIYIISVSIDRHIDQSYRQKLERI